MRNAKAAKAVKRRKTPPRMFSRKWAKKMNKAIDLLDRAITLAKQECHIA